MSMNLKAEPGFLARAKKDIKKYYLLYIMALPLLAYYILFRYVPMYGTIISFLDFRPVRGILGSDWVGLKNFTEFFGSVYFSRLIRNTLVLSLETLIFGFPAPILLALLFNELRGKAFKKIVQSVSYLPHFISVIVICGIVKNFTASTGAINVILSYLGIEKQTMLLNPSLFRPIYVLVGIWQGVGWGSIIYLAALSGVDVQLYEAARIDGAGRFSQMIHITLPGILPTIIIMLILRMGRIMDIGYEMIMLLYNEVIYETADVISTYVYRRGLLEGEYDFSTAVSLFNSVINFILIISANAFSRMVNETSLW